MRERERPKVGLDVRKVGGIVVPPCAGRGEAVTEASAPAGLFSGLQNRGSDSCGSFLSVEQQVHLQRLGQWKAQYPLSQDVQIGRAHV